MKTRGKLLVVFTIISLIGISLLMFNSNSVLGIPSDIDYTFENDNRYNDTVIAYDDDFNGGVSFSIMEARIITW